MNRRFAIAGLASLLSGCGVQKAIPKIAKVILDPKIAVGEPEEQLSQIALHAYAAAEVNRNFDGEASPVVVKIFALSSDHRLFGLDFFSIVEDPAMALGVTLVAELDENMLAPDSYKILGPYEIPKKAKKIAVVAEYLDIDTAVWRASIDIESIGSDDRLLLLLLEEEVRLMKEET
jgi:type VI secretion system protein VasD